MAGTNRLGNMWHGTQLWWYCAAASACVSCTSPPEEPSFARAALEGSRGDPAPAEEPMERTEAELLAELSESERELILLDEEVPAPYYPEDTPYEAPTAVDRLRMTIQGGYGVPVLVDVVTVEHGDNSFLLTGTREDGTPIVVNFNLASLCAGANPPPAGVQALLLISPVGMDAETVDIYAGPGSDYSVNIIGDGTIALGAESVDVSTIASWRDE